MPTVTVSKEVLATFVAAAVISSLRLRYERGFGSFQNSIDEKIDLMLETFFRRGEQ